MTPLRSYLICSSPRTGSTLLEHALGMTGIAGYPKEYYDFAHEAYWQERLQFTPDNYFEKIFEAGSTPNGVFAAKLFWFQAKNLAKRLKKPAIFTDDTSDSLETYFPGLRYIWLSRRDKIRQAVSYFKTDITQIWWVHHDKKQVPVDEESIRAQFNFEAIDDKVIELTQADAHWRNYFEQRSIKPLEIVYEDMVASYDATVLKVLQWLELNVPPDYKVPPPQLLKQSDHISEEWVAKYLDIKKHLPEIPPIKAS